jgi:catalase
MKTIQPNFSRHALRSPLIAATLSAVLCGPGLSAHAADLAAVDAKPVPLAAVDALNKLSGGPHAGYRANHAKGVLVMGSFTPAESAASLSKAAHFALGQSVPVLVRFSNGTGVPTLPDASPNASPHGIAIRFDLPQGASTDIVSISANGFPVATPEEFVALLEAIGHSGPGSAKPSPIEQFMGSHPIALKWASTPRPPPVSFGTLAFYGVNAFKFTNTKGESQFVRYQILPVAGEHSLSEADAAKAAPNYLMDELPARIASSPVKFRLLAQVAEAGDSINDGSVVWPQARKLVELGTISLTKTAPDQVKEQKVLLFNPLSLTAGIEASADPVLLIRPAAYGVSFVQRAQ